MGTEINPAWISAAAALLGTIVGGLLAVGKDVFLERRKLAREKTYLAVIVSSRLNEFARQCSHVAFDDGTIDGMPAGRNESEHEPTTSTPTFQPLEISVNWEVIPSALLDSIFRLPDRQAEIERHLTYLANHELDPPQYSEFFRTRRCEYAKLGVKASLLSNKLRSEASLQLERPGSAEWDIVEAMRGVISMTDI